MWLVTVRISQIYGYVFQYWYGNWNICMHRRCATDTTVIANEWGLFWSRHGPKLGIAPNLTLSRMLMLGWNLELAISKSDMCLFPSIIFFSLWIHKIPSLLTPSKALWFSLGPSVWNLDRLTLGTVSKNMSLLTIQLPKFSLCTFGHGEIQLHDSIILELSII